MEDISYSLKARLALESAGFDYTRSLGQNFIFDEALLDKIAMSGGARPGVNVLEVGIGAGMLTNSMLKLGCKVLAIELDKNLEPVLDRLFDEKDNLKIVFADALKTDIDSLTRTYFGQEEYIVCANLPYYITSDFITRTLMLDNPPSQMTLMLQKEAAQRLLSMRGEPLWGATAALISLCAEGEILFEVSRENFTPRPHVDSCVVKLIRRKEPLVSPDELKPFARFIKAAFALRRKTLVNCLNASCGVSKQQVSDALAQIGLSALTRGEELELETLKRLFDLLKGDI
ncbi:MAG: ribosomal RNA small subunit methyltransferase A [Clostridia bacterium]|nr:ribosomal RNA small subunit methyltransferase A [Clostridia bacterium]